MDKKSVKILLDTIKKSQEKELKNWFYWDTYMTFINEEDFIYAKQHFVMFDQEKISHNEIFSRIKVALNKIKEENVVNAFVYSLSSRNLQYRSFISSYCIAKSLMEHDFTPCPEPNLNICSVCGVKTYELDRKIEFNTINYFKYKYGSCFDNVIQILFDLEQFSNYPLVTPTAEDLVVLREIKKAMESTKVNDRIPQLKKLISKIIKSNDEERLAILEIFGVIGILHDNEHYGYADKYITFLERKHRGIRFDDVKYPANWWLGKFGIDYIKWDYWFKNFT